jgi:phospholipase C
MYLKHRNSTLFKCGAAMIAALQVFAGLPQPAFAQNPSRGNSADMDTRTPIKHVIVIIGENRSFDNVFATYKPREGQKVENLLSEGIVNADGTPGPNYWKAEQKEAVDMGSYQVSPTIAGTYSVLPPVLAGGPTVPYISSLAEAEAVETGLPNQQYYTYLTTGGTGLPSGAIDTRIPNATSLPPGPFQLTPGVAYDAYAASPVHRYYQMVQQMDCNVANATPSNPSGCKNDLFPWVETSVGTGSNGKAQPAGFNDMSTHEGSASMGFYNVQEGDAPYLTYLADHYTMSDNYHQAALGGTGLNHIELGSGDAMWYSDGHGNATMPPANQIENPDAQPGTNNYYTQDGYSGGSYSNCSDASQPGVSAVRTYLNSLPYKVDAKCQAGHYYLLNNYNPGYFGDGTVDTSDTYTIPPSTVRTIGDALLAKNISFAYFGDQWNLYKNDPHYQNPADVYCNICNFLQYTTSIMTNPALRSAHIKDTVDLYADIQNGTLPAVSYVKPSGLVDGHPASSKLDLFEGFVKKIVDGVQANPKLWASTAIFVTFDEGGGYYDSGYIQPLDYFGDGTRVPMIVVSKYTQAGRISHTYADHVSILKFIERNWDLKPITDRSRDNLPDPKTTAANPYVPMNSPAIGDLFDLFNFGRRDDDGGRMGR